MYVFFRLFLLLSVNRGELVHRLLEKHITVSLGLVRLFLFEVFDVFESSALYYIFLVNCKYFLFGLILFLYRV